MAKITTNNLGLATRDLNDYSTTLVRPVLEENMNSTNGNMKKIDDAMGGTLESLTTTAKSIIPAINELDANIGNLSNLQTSSKTDLVGATNELDENIKNLINGITNITYNNTISALKSTTTKTAIDELASKSSSIVNVQSFGAKGEFNPSTGIGADDTVTIQSAIDYCQTTNKTLYFPSTLMAYKITSTINITKPITIISDAMAVLYISVANNIAGIHIKTSKQLGNIKLPILSGAGTGTAILVEDSNAMQIDFHLLDNFDVGVHFKSVNMAVLDDYLTFNLLGNVNTAIKCETTNTNFTMEGIKANFNFITQCKYGLEFVQNGGEIKYNEFIGTAIHCTRSNSSCIYGNRVVYSTFKINGFLYGETGILIGGTLTYHDKAKYIEMIGCIIEAIIMNNKEVNLIGNTIIRNYTNIQSAHNETTGIVAVTGTDITTFNGGIPSNCNHTLITIDLPILNDGQTMTFYMFHQFCGGSYPKRVGITYSTPPTDFVVTAREIDYSGIEKCIAITVNATKNITVAKNIKFYVDFE